MKITDRFHAALAAAKADGYERVACIIGTYMSTTYVRLHDIDDLLAMPVGTATRGGRPLPCRGMWTGRPNTRHLGPTDIRYQTLMDRYADPVEDLV